MDYILEADAAVTSFKTTSETRLSSRLRNTDFLWGGLPVISSKGDFFSSIIKKHEIGYCVRKQDAYSWQKGFEKMSDPDVRNSCRKNIEKVKQNFQWEKLAEPLIHFCVKPQKKKKIQRKNFFSSPKLKNKKLIIFGASRAGLRALMLARNFKANVISFVDNNESLKGGTIEGIKIDNPGVLLKKHFSRIIIASFPGRAAIENQLKKMGFKKESFIWFGNLIKKSEKSP